jgi:hypothetical protein
LPPLRLRRRQRSDEPVERVKKEMAQSPQLAEVLS